MADVTHKDVVDAIIAALKDLTLRGYTASDIKTGPFPFRVQPPFGLIVSALTETTGDSTNETTDIGFPVQVTRVLGGLDPATGFDGRDNWRRDVFKRFNCVRLGLSCELMTRAELGEIEIKPAWDKWNLDASVMKITVWIRVPIGP
jgi:hypothetical protein